MSKILTLYIDSKNRSLITDPTGQFIYNINFGSNTNMSYYIKSVSIPLSGYVSVYIPNNGSGEQTFQFSDISGVHTAAIPSGNYSGGGLASAIQTEMNSFGGLVYSVVYNIPQNTFTISASGTFQIAFTANNALYPYQSLGTVLGFRDQYYNPVNQPGAATWTSLYPANLSGPQNYSVRSRALTVGNNSVFDNNFDSVICTIPNNVAPFSILRWDNPNAVFEPLYKVNISQVDLQLIDDFGNTINLNGDDWCICVVLRAAQD